MGILKELAIHCSIDTVSERVETPIALLMSFITNKHTFDGSGFKFIPMLFWEMNIYGTTKNSRW